MRRRPCWLQVHRMRPLQQAFMLRCQLSEASQPPSTIAMIAVAYQTLPREELEFLAFVFGGNRSIGDTRRSVTQPNAITTVPRSHQKVVCKHDREADEDPKRAEKIEEWG